VYKASQMRNGHAPVQYYESAGVIRVQTRTQVAQLTLVRRKIRLLSLYMRREDRSGVDIAGCNGCKLECSRIQQDRHVPSGAPRLEIALQVSLGFQNFPKILA